MRGSTLLQAKLKRASTRWTHRKTWPDHRANDRVVLRDGETVARIYQFEHGPQRGAWAWFGRWAGADNSGAADTLSEALEAVRDQIWKVFVEA